MIRPTRAGWGVVACGVALLAVGRLFGTPELFVLGAGAIALAVFAAVWTALNGVRLLVNRTARPARLRVGGPATVDLSLTNRNRMPTPVLSLNDRVGGTPGAALMLAPLRGRKSRTVSYRLPTIHRGRIPIGPLTVVSGDPLGLVTSTLTGGDITDIVVHPKVWRLPPVRALAGQDPRTPERTRHTVATSGDEFYALRPYEIGDELRRVHWPSSARSTELMVRQPEQDQTGWLTIILDVGADSYADSASFERAVSAAASVLYATNTLGTTGRFLTTAGEVDAVQFASAAQVGAIDSTLALIEPTRSGSLSRCLSNGAAATGGQLVIITGLDAAAWSAIVAAAGSALRRGQVVVVGTGEDPPVTAPRWQAVPFGPGDDFTINWSRSYTSATRLAGR